jgi:hypothetical protein
MPHGLGASQHRTFPHLNLHRARVRRNHGRPHSNGFIERARKTLPDFTAQSQRASDKALTFGLGNAANGGSLHLPPSTPCFSLAPAFPLDAVPSRLSHFSPSAVLPRPLIRGQFYRGGKGTLSSRFNMKPTLVLVSFGQGHRDRRKYK